MDRKVRQPRLEFYARGIRAGYNRSQISFKSCSASPVHAVFNRLQVSDTLQKIVCIHGWPWASYRVGKARVSGKILAGDFGAFILDCEVGDIAAHEFSPAIIVIGIEQKRSAP
jgi:hypothetical protein